MISFDDSSKDKNIYFYNKRINFENGFPQKVEDADEIIDYVKSQPLNNELQYFVNNLDNKINVADGKSGLEVVKVLEKVQEILGEEK